MIRLLIAALAVCFAGSAWATTLTFDTLGYITPIQEKGYTYTNFSSYHVSPNIYLHDDGGGQRSVTISRVDGGQFDANSAVVAGNTRLYTTGTQAQFDALGSCCSSYVPGQYDPWSQAAQPSFDNFKVEGFRNGQLVAYTSGSATDPRTLSFGSSFSDLTSIKFSIKFPDFQYQLTRYVPLTPLTNYCWDYCVNFTLDNLNLTDPISPVPLPASGLLLGMGLLGVGALRLRKRHQA